ncbi:hypothetical protein [Bradyrhizobium sp. HKCCYLS2033]|uniref:hypothetical protein n=1 Tax=unclassified Bradyrhizobium TaxID=2631580 RepID=UPI003EBE56ED
MQTVMLRRIRRIFLVVAWAVTVLLTVVALPAFAEGDRVIAVPELHAMTPEARDEADLMTSALRVRFQALPSLRLVDRPVPLVDPDRPDILLPKFEQLRDLHFDLVLVGNAAVLSDGRHKVSLRIWNVEKRQQLVGQQYVFNAHQGYDEEIADQVRDALMAALSQ